MALAELDTDGDGEISKEEMLGYVFKNTKQQADKSTSSINIAVVVALLAMVMAALLHFEVVSIDTIMGSPTLD